MATETSSGPVEELDEDSRNKLTRCLVNWNPSSKTEHFGDHALQQAWMRQVVTTPGRALSDPGCGIGDAGQISKILGVLNQVMRIDCPDEAGTGTMKYWDYVYGMFAEKKGNLKDTISSQQAQLIEQAKEAAWRALPDEAKAAMSKEAFDSAFADQIADDATVKQIEEFTASLNAAGY